MKRRRGQAKKRDYKFKKHYCKVSAQTAFWACENYKERQLVFFLKLKRHYINGYIKTPEKKYKELGQGMSRRNYLRKLEDMKLLGWCRVSKGGISLIGIDRLPVKSIVEHDRHFYLHNDDTLDYVAIRHLVVVNSEMNQKPKIKSHSELRPEVLVKGNKVGGYEKMLHDPSKDVSMSIKTLATKFNRCGSTAIRFMNKARMRGIIKTRERYSLEPLRETNYRIFFGQKFKRIANEIEVVFDRKIKDIVFFSNMDREERVVSMYTNDCF